jgi:hypothetical protein
VLAHAELVDVVVGLLVPHEHAAVDQLAEVLGAFGVDRVGIGVRALRQVDLGL